jgi:uncharacterized membrane protein
VQWEAKSIGLAVIFVYAFFKFAWSYRLYNYLAIMVGAAPPSERRRIRRRPGPMPSIWPAYAMWPAGISTAGSAPSSFALGYLGWFLSPWLFMATSVAVAAVMWRRQFASDSRRALIGD